MKNDILKQIYNTLNLRETADLISIWYEDDREQWSDSAFQSIEQILLERLGEIPPRSESEITISLDSSGRKNDPEFYKPQSVISLASWINKVAVFSIFNTLILSITSYPVVGEMLKSFVGQSSDMIGFYQVFIYIIMTLLTPIYVAFTYFALKALVFHFIHLDGNGVQQPQTAINLPGIFIPKISG